MSFDLDDFLDGFKPDYDKMTLEELFDRFVQAPGSSGLLVFSRSQWFEINKRYKPEQLKKAFARHYRKHGTPFPWEPPTLDEAKEKFLALTAMSGGGTGKQERNVYQSRYTYENWTPDNVLAILDNSGQSRFNVISDAFQWKNRLRCGGWKDPSPFDVWESEDLLAKVRWPFWTLNKNKTYKKRLEDLHTYHKAKAEAQGLDPNLVPVPWDDESVGEKIWDKVPSTKTDWLAGVKTGGGTYTPAQFRPAAARAMYWWLKAERVLDPSCGWGDRLAGFFTTDTAKVYAGCDPNEATYAVYSEQATTYETWLGTEAPNLERFTIRNIKGGPAWPAFRCRGVKDVLIVNGPFEDIDWAQVRDLVAPNGFDLAFTSPPYFAVEKYAAGTPSADNQSWSRYTTFEDGWLKQFLFVVCDTLAEMVRPGGIVALNIVDPLIKDTRNKACDPMVEHLVEQGMTYLGVVPMVMPKKPGTNAEQNKIKTHDYSEPVWVWSKGAVTLPPPDDVSLLQLSLGDLFGDSDDDE